MKRKETRAAFRLSSIEQVKAAADPFRLEVLRAFGREARSPKQVAVEMGIPPSRIYHHVRVLENAGLLELVESRPKRGTVERIYRTAAQSFLAPNEMFGDQEEIDSQRIAEMMRAGKREDAPFQPTTVSTAFRVHPKNAVKIQGRVIAFLTRLNREYGLEEEAGEAIALSVVLTSPRTLPREMIG